ncbi:hypothetical protein Tco_1522795 [Tanacetum coccineum]
MVFHPHRKERRLRRNNGNEKGNGRKIIQNSENGFTRSSSAKLLNENHSYWKDDIELIDMDQKMTNIFMKRESEKFSGSSKLKQKVSFGAKGFIKGVSITPRKGLGNVENVILILSNLPGNNEISITFELWLRNGDGDVLTLLECYLENESSISRSRIQRLDRIRGNPQIDFMKCQEAESCIMKRPSHTLGKPLDSLGIGTGFQQLDF